MTDTPYSARRARGLALFLGLGLLVMLGISLKVRFEHPHLTVENRQPAPAARDSGQAAIGDLMRQVAENPRDSKAMIHLVEHLVTVQNWEAAETFAQRAITLDVNNPRPLYLLGVVQHNQGRHKEAAATLEKVLTLKDDAAVRYSLGVLYLYYLDEPERGIAQLSAGLHSPEAGEDLKAAIRAELEKAPLPQQGADKK